MHLTLLKPGIFTSLQHAGLTGFRSIGLGPGGVMDAFAARAANALVRNEANSSVLEMHFPAPELQFSVNTLIGLTGGDFGAVCNGKPLANWRTHVIAAGEIVRFTRLISGYRAYLSVYSGFEPESPHAIPVPPKPLQVNDRIALCAEYKIPASVFQSEILPEVYEPVYAGSTRIFCTEGPEWETMNEAQQTALLQNEYTVSPQSNRMSIVLNGTLVPGSGISGILSSATDAGTVQLLPNGLPVILMAGHQTTGGYSRILSVLPPSLAQLAQMRPGTAFRFCRISLPEAAEQLISWKEKLTAFK